MRDFPLAPFLVSLAADGIQLTLRDYERVALALQGAGLWTLSRLRDTLLALLAKDDEQHEVLTRRFNEFFRADLVVNDDLAALNVRQVLGDLRQLVTEGAAIAPPPPPRPPLLERILPQRFEPPRLQLDFWTGWFALLFIGVGLIAALLLWPDRPTPAPTVLAPTPVTTTIARPRASSSLSQRQRLYSDVPVAAVRYEQLSTFPLWQRYAVTAALCLLAALLYGLYLWRAHKIPDDVAPVCNPDGPRHFALGSIGGQPAPRLTDPILNELADAMGYFQSNERGQRLNVAASILTTMRKGGTPALEFFKRQQLRSLLILEDALAEALTWNPLAHELATGMARLGVPVLYGHFYGSPAQFKTVDGTRHRLEDLEDQRQGYLLLLFTDGKSLQHEEHRFVLEALTHWPMIAWIDLREPRHWDETLNLPAAYGLLVYPATPAGLLQAVRGFLSEQWATPGYTRSPSQRTGLPSQAGSNLAGYVEQQLGDALLWAQACAMIQPVTPGLADRLRRTFHPTLPAERLERLYTLPGTQHNISGLRFSHEILRVLRSGFLVRRSDAEQEAVLRFLLAEIGKVEPVATDSPAHLAWEAVRERVHLEVDQDAALARLAQLVKSPIGPAISASFEHFGFREEADHKIPLRLKPTNPYAWQRLARITDSFAIPKLEAYPIGWGHRVAMGLLSLLLVSFASLSVAAYVTPPPPAHNWRVVGNPQTLALLKLTLDPAAPPQRKSGEVGALAQLPLPISEDHQLVLYGGGHRMEYKLPIKPHQMAVITITTPITYQVPAQCQDELGPNLFAVRCADEYLEAGRRVSQPSWRTRVGAAAPPGQLTSIGVEFNRDGDDEPTFKRVRNLLLKSSSVDVVYQLWPDGEGHWPLNQLLEELEPLAGHSQLFWWETEREADYSMLTPLLEHFPHHYQLGDGASEEWVDRLEDLLHHSAQEVIAGTELAAALGRPVEDSPIMLLSLPSIVADIAPTPTISASLELTPVIPSDLFADDVAQPRIQITGIDTNDFPNIKVTLYGENLGVELDSLPITLFEDNAEQPIQSRTVEDIGIQVAFAFDGSDNLFQPSSGNSGRTGYEEFSTAVETVVDVYEALSPATDWTAAYITGLAQDRFRPIVDWTQDHGATRNAILGYSHNEDTPRTSLFELILYVLDRFEDSRIPANLMRSIVLFSDGFDATSDLDIQGAILRAEEMNVRIYTVMVGPENLSRRSNLERIAKLTGGIFTLLTDPATDLDSVWGALAGQRSQLVLNYRLAKAQPEDLEIRTNIPNRPSLIETVDYPVIPMNPVEIQVVQPITETQITNISSGTQLPIQLQFNWHDERPRALKRVEYIINDDTKIQDLEPLGQFSFPIGNFANGRYMLRVRAIDEFDLVSESAPVTFDIVRPATSSDAVIDVEIDITYKLPIYVGVPAIFTATVTGSDANTLDFFWRFGDSKTMEGQIVSHAYGNTGNYIVSLLVTGPEGMQELTRPINVIVSPTPIPSATQARITEAPIRGLKINYTTPIITDHTVVFSATVEAGTNVSYRWSFSDGTTATTPTVTRSFGSAGSFQVSVTASNSLGSVSADVQLTVLSTPPASLQVIDNSPKAPGEPVIFVALVESRETVSYRWNFGDGAVASTTEGRISHVYRNPGKYTVTVIASNSAGQITTTVIAYVGVNRELP